MSSFTDGTAAATLYDFERSHKIERASVTASAQLEIAPHTPGRTELDNEPTGSRSPDLTYDVIATREPLAPTKVGSITELTVVEVKGTELDSVSRAQEPDKRWLEYRDSLERSKKQLLGRKYKGGKVGELPPEDKRQLDYVMWQLDRIEHVKVAGDLTDIRRIAELQEQFARKMQGFVSSLAEITKPQRRGHR